MSGFVPMVKSYGYQMLRLLRWLVTVVKAGGLIELETSSDRMDTHPSA